MPATKITFSPKNEIIQKCRALFFFFLIRKILKIYINFFVCLNVKVSPGIKKKKKKRAVHAHGVQSRTLADD